jgi:hypothetical protein
LDLEGVVLPLVASDGLRHLVKVPLLSLDIVSPSLKSNIISTNAFSNSVEWKLRDNVEWSVDVETKFFIESLSFSLWTFIKIQDIPFLVDTLAIVIDSNWLSLLILRWGVKDSIVILEVNKLRA